MNLFADKRESSFDLIFFDKNYRWGWMRSEVSKFLGFHELKSEIDVRRKQSCPL